MALPDVAKQMILEAGGQAMLDRALAADSKAVQDTAKLDALGVASKNYDNYDGSEVVSAAQKADATAQAQVAMEARLKVAEIGLESVLRMNDTIKTLEDTVKTLSDDLEAAKTREATAQQTIIDMQAKLGLFTDLRPPASQSTETLLSDREKTLVDSMMAQAKTADQPSLVDIAIGGSPAFNS